MEVMYFFQSILHWSFQPRVCWLQPRKVFWRRHLSPGDARAARSFHLALRFVACRSMGHTHPNGNLDGENDDKPWHFDGFSHTYFQTKHVKKQCVEETFGTQVEQCLISLLYYGMLYSCYGLWIPMAGFKMFVFVRFCFTMNQCEAVWTTRHQVVSRCLKWMTSQNQLHGVTFSRCFLKHQTTCARWISAHIDVI